MKCNSPYACLPVAAARVELVWGCVLSWTGTTLTGFRRGGTLTGTTTGFGSSTCGRNDEG